MVKGRKVEVPLTKAKERSQKIPPPSVAVTKTPAAKSATLLRGATTTKRTALSAKDNGVQYQLFRLDAAHGLDKIVVITILTITHSVSTCQPSAKVRVVEFGCPLITLLKMESPLVDQWTQRRGVVIQRIVAVKMENQEMVDPKTEVQWILLAQVMELTLQRAPLT